MLTGPKGVWHCLTYTTVSCVVRTRNRRASVGLSDGGSKGRQARHQRTVRQQMDQRQGDCVSCAAVSIHPRRFQPVSYTEA